MTAHGGSDTTLVYLRHRTGHGVHAPAKMFHLGTGGTGPPQDPKKSAEEEGAGELEEEDMYNPFRRRRRRRRISFGLDFDIHMSEHVDLTIEFIRKTFLLGLGTDLKRQAALIVAVQEKLSKQSREWDTDFRAAILAPEKFFNVSEKDAKQRSRAFIKLINAHIILARDYALALSKNDMSRAQDASSMLTDSNAKKIVDSLTAMVTRLNPKTRSVFKKERLDEKGIQDLISGEWTHHMKLTIQYINALVVMKDERAFETAVLRAQKQGENFGMMLNTLIENRK